jgi:hypothetical protein
MLPLPPTLKSKRQRKYTIDNVGGGVLRENMPILCHFSELSTRRLPNSRLGPRLSFKSHSASRPPQTPAASS